MSASDSSVKVSSDKIRQIDLETQVLREQLKERYYTDLQHLPIDDPIRLQAIEEGDNKLASLFHKRAVEYENLEKAKRLEEEALYSAKKLKLLLSIDTPVYRNIKKMREIMMLAKPEISEWRVTMIMVEAPITWNGDMSVGVGIINGDNQHDSIIKLFQDVTSLSSEEVVIKVLNLTGFIVWFLDGFQFFPY